MGLNTRKLESDIRSKLRNDFIPIYRAKKIDSDDWVAGCLVKMKTMDKITGSSYTGYFIKSDTYRINSSSFMEVDKATILLSYNGKDFISLQEAYNTLTNNTKENE